MKALCVRQPYAELIARGTKTIEVRTWHPPKDYRGSILIVASSQPWRDDMAKYGMTVRDCLVSSAVCVVDLVEVKRAPMRGWCDGALCDVERGDLLWVLRNPRRVQPFHVKGKLRLFDLPDASIRLVCGACGNVRPEGQMSGAHGLPGSDRICFG